VRRSQAMALAGAGAAAFALSLRLARGEDPKRIESRVFHAVNGAPDGLYPVLWGPMQLGNLVVGAVVALAVALVGRRRKVAVAALAAVGLKLVVERVIRDRLTADLDRQRPGTSQEGAVLRGDVPSEGHSFPSGHVILVAALAAVLTPMLPRRWSAVPWAAVGLVAFGRVYVGAHNPLDVTAGAGAGVAVGAVLDAVVGDEHRHPSRLPQT
jgi:membrane-associated phospholipid phosphatase